MKKIVPVDSRSVVSSVIGGSSKMSVMVRRELMRCLSSLCSLGGGGKSSPPRGSSGMLVMEESASM